MTTSILQRIASGDASAVRECIEHYGALVGSMARRLSKTSSDAEDATQEIFLQIWRQASRFDASLGSEKNFIAMLARRRLIDRLRKTDVDPLMGSAEALEFVAWTAPGNTLETSQEAGRAMRALKELRLEYRQVLELGCLHGLSHSEIASRLGLPLGTVKSFTRRGLMRIRECLTSNLPPAVAKPCRSRLRAIDAFPIHRNRPDRPAVAVRKRLGIAKNTPGNVHFEVHTSHVFGLGVDKIA